MAYFQKLVPTQSRLHTEKGLQGILGRKKYYLFIFPN